MRASIILLVVVGLFASNQAAVEDLVDAGKTLVGSLLTQLKEKAAAMAQDLLGNLLGSLAGTLGKRELLPFKDHVKNVLGQLANLMDAGKALAGSAFGNAVNKLKAIAAKWHAKLGLLKDAKPVKDEIDDTVAEHHVQQKRILGDLLDAGKALLGSALQKAKDALGSLKETASGLVSTLLQQGANILVGKRTTLSEHLSNIGGALSGAVSPFKDIVAGLGNTLKGHFSNLVDTVKGHVSALSGKLAGHVSDLKTHGSTLLEHGKNALGAISEVVSDILRQTLTNAKPAIDGLASTGIDAANTVLGHLSGANKPATF